MNPRFKDVLLLDAILLFLSLFFGVAGFCTVFVMVVIYTLLWIGGNM